MSDPAREARPVTVGFAGLGRMGFAMARNVLGAGFPLIVFNRTASRATPLVDEGAAAVTSPTELGVCDIVVTMVSDGGGAWEILVDGGLLDALRPGSVVLEMSTIGPTAAQGLAGEAEQRGVQLLDAPVSGSVSVAEAGQLFAMVGGDGDAYKRAIPVLDAMTKGHAFLGRSGAGAAMKLALNAMVAATNESVAETIALAKRFGIDPETAYDVLSGGALASPFLQYKRRAFLHPESEPAAFTAALMRKDLALVEELASRLDVRMPVAEAAAQVLDEALASGLGEADMASVLRLLDGNVTTPAGRARPHDPREES